MKPSIKIVAIKQQIVLSDLRDKTARISCIHTAIVDVIIRRLGKQHRIVGLQDSKYSIATNMRVVSFLYNLYYT
jgi:hypothetical protein